MPAGGCREKSQAVEDFFNKAIDFFLGEAYLLFMRPGNPASAIGKETTVKKLLDFIGDVALALMAVAAIGIAEMFVVTTALELVK